MTTLPAKSRGAKRAKRLLRMFYSGHGHDTDYCESAVDLLTDLMHLATREGWDFEDMMLMARGHHDAEAANVTH